MPDNPIRRLFQRATGSTAQPGDFPVGSAESRAAARAALATRNEPPEGFIGLNIHQWPGGPPEWLYPDLPKWNKADGPVHPWMLAHYPALFEECPCERCRAAFHPDVTARYRAEVG